RADRALSAHALKRIRVRFQSIDGAHKIARHDNARADVVRERSRSSRWCRSMFTIDLGKGEAMLDQQDARTESLARPEPTVVPPRSRGRRRGLIGVIAVVAAVALAAVGFAVGRASDDSVSSGAVTTRPGNASSPDQAVTRGTVPTVPPG